MDLFSAETPGLQLFVHTGPAINSAATLLKDFKCLWWLSGALPRGLEFLRPPQINPPAPPLPPIPICPTFSEGEPRQWSRCKRAGINLWASLGKLLRPFNEKFLPLFEILFSGDILYLSSMLFLPWSFLKPRPGWDHLTFNDSWPFFPPVSGCKFWPCLWNLQMQKSETLNFLSVLKSQSCVFAFLNFWFHLKKQK